MSHMTVGKKLYLSFGAALTVTLLAGLFSLRSIGNVGTATNSLAQVETKKLYLTGEISTVNADISSLERALILRSIMHDKPSVEKYNQSLQEDASKMKSMLDELSPMLVTEAGKRAAGNLIAAQEQLVRAHESVYRLAADDKGNEALQLFIDQMLPAVMKAREEADKLAKITNDRTAAQGKAAAEEVSQSRWITAFLILLSFAVGAVGMFVVRQINRTLRETVASLAAGAEQMASAASQVSSGSQMLAQGASEQAASLEETSASTEEINSMTRKNADNSLHAAKIVTKAGEDFVDTNRKLADMLASMNQINASSDKISKIIKVIDEIAFQTNILALNAAVEAARAGESGMGFAVVADEVRNLAQRCAQAAKDTETLIQETINNCQQGSMRLSAVESAVKELSHEAGEIKVLVDEVSMGSQEQSSGLEQIAKAVEQMEQVTQKTAAAAEESAAAGEELSAQAETLRGIVDLLNSMVGSSEEPVKLVAASHAPAANRNPRNFSLPKPKFPSDNKLSAAMTEEFSSF